MTEVDSAAWTGRTWTMCFRVVPGRFWSRFGKRPGLWNSWFCAVQRVRCGAEDGELLPTWGLSLGWEPASDIRGVLIYWNKRRFWLYAETGQSLLMRRVRAA